MVSFISWSPNTGTLFLILTCIYAALRQVEQKLTFILLIYCIWIMADLRMTTIKEGEVIRSPALGFGDGFHIQFSAKHGWFIELNTGSLHLLYPKKKKKMIPSKKNHRFQVVLNVNKVDDVGHTLSFTYTK